MASLPSRRPAPHLVKNSAVLAFLSLLLLLIGCGAGGADEPGALPVGPAGTSEVDRPTVTPEPTAPLLDLELTQKDLSVEPLPLRAGFPFTATALIHNNTGVSAVDVPVMVYISARQEEIGYSAFLQVLTVTVPASESVPVDVPVNWNFAGGEHELWVQVNRLPKAWQPRVPTQAETDTSNNLALLDLQVNPFDAYVSNLCSGRVDVEVGPADIQTGVVRQQVRVRVHNVGNRAVYNLPVVITGKELTGIAYTPAIPPCGGTAEVSVELNRPLEEGEAISVQVNPKEWAEELQEDSLDNNQVTVTAGVAPETAYSSGAEQVDYDFALSATDIETPEKWMVLVTVHNLGTRDAAQVPIRIQNQAGRKVVDVIPLVQGEGIGVAAIRVGYLWTPGGTLTFTVNPADAKGAFPEKQRENNVVTFPLP
jgi:hypothetical protein